ncbi:MAG: methylmalonyl-CoA epimerase [Thermoplasmata archaeon]
MELDHVGIAVRALEPAMATYQDGLGLAPGVPEVVTSQKVRVSFIEVRDTHIELLEPTDASSPIARFLDSRGEGLHHLAFRVPSVDRALDGLAQQGRKLIDRVGRPGARGRRVGFAHPSAFHGTLVEFVELP